MDMMHVLFSLFGMPVTAYALCLAAAAALGLLLLVGVQKKHGLRGDTAEIFALLALPLGLVGARLFYCLCRLDFYIEMGPMEMLRWWHGGYALWGAVGGAMLAALLTAKITKQSPVKLLDALAAPAALTIALGRLAEAFNGEGIGRMIDTETIPALLQKFPFAVPHPQWEEPCWAIFMLEALAALIILAVLLWKKTARAGDNAKLFLILFSASQSLLEILRADNFLHWTRVFIRPSQLTAVLVMAGLMLHALLRWRKASARMPKPQVILHWGIFIACVGVSIWMQFAVQKSASIPAWLCYLVMALCSAGFGVTACRLVFRSVKG